MTNVTHHEATLAAAVAAFFKARPNIWVDGRDVMQIAGAYGWRTRISDVRRAPFHMRIDNRQRRIRARERSFTVSEYRYTPTASAAAGQLELLPLESSRWT